MLGHVWVVALVSLCHAGLRCLVTGQTYGPQREPGDAHQTRGQQSWIPPVQLGYKCEALPDKEDASFYSLTKKKSYVDKTIYLHKLGQLGRKFVLLTRPRKFGKTLMIDTMEQFFNGYKEMFEGTEIYPLCPENWPSYPVVRLSLESLSFETEEYFTYTLIYIMRQVARSNAVHLYDNSHEYTVENATQALITALVKKHNSSLVILIDDYDKPYTKKYLYTGEDSSEITLCLERFLKTLFSAGKNIHFLFITGRLRIAPPEFFANIDGVVDLTLDPDFAEMFGFTDEQACQHYGRFIEEAAKKRQKSVDEIMFKLREWTLGFQFTEKNESIFSPVSVITYLSTRGDAVKGWTLCEGGQVVPVGVKEFPQRAIEILVKGGAEDVVNANHTVHPLLATRRELLGKVTYSNGNHRGLIAALYQMGFLSVWSYNNVTDLFALRFTSLEVKWLYTEYCG